MDLAVMYDGVEKLAALPTDIVREIISGIPREWEVDADTRAAMSRLICERAVYVKDSMIGRIWPELAQQAFDFHNDEQGRQS